MRNKVGPPVVGEDFFGREKEIAYVWKKLTEGNNLLLPSPRRVGKSSFAKKLIEEAREEKWQTIEINLENITSEIGFLESFVGELRKLSWWNSAKEKGNKLLSHIQKLKPSLEYEGVKASIEWSSEKASLSDQFNTVMNHGTETLIFLDEVGVFLNAITTDQNEAKPAEHFLHWLRDLRQHSDSKIQWIFCSSIGIQNFTFTHNISDTINDLLPYQLLAFSEEESTSLIKKLEKSNEKIKFNKKIRTKIHQKLEYCLPFFLQVIFQKMESLILLEDKEVNESLVDEAYKRILQESHLNTWIERINEQYGLVATDLKIVLKHLSQEKKGSKRSNLLGLLVMKMESELAEETLNKILYILSNDGYIMEENGLHRFRSPLLRDFWYTRFVK